MQIDVWKNSELILLLSMINIFQWNANWWVEVIHIETGFTNTVEEIVSHAYPY